MRLPLLILHILAGTFGLLAGTLAMNVRKGGRLHRASGNVCIGGIIDSRSWIQAFGDSPDGLLFLYRIVEELPTIRD